MESLTKECFNECLEDLIAAYKHEATKQQMEVFYKYLKPEFTNDSFAETCKITIVKEKFFPSISVLIENKQLTEEEKTWKAIL